MKYFTFIEFYHSDLADTLGIVNLPSPGDEEIVRANILNLVDHVLDPVRIMVQQPVRITSGYRCPELNKLAGGKKFSQHLVGQAADFTIDGFSPRDYKKLACWCAENIDFDQLIVHSMRKFIHISYVSPEINRHEVLFT